MPDKRVAIAASGFSGIPTAAAKSLPRPHGSTPKVTSGTRRDAVDDFVEGAIAAASDYVSCAISSGFLCETLRIARCRSQYELSVLSGFGKGSVALLSNIFSMSLAGDWVCDNNKVVHLLRVFGYRLSVVGAGLLFILTFFTKAVNIFFTRIVVSINSAC